MAGKVKITRKDLKGPDEFVQFTTKAYGWVNQNQRTIIYVLVAALLVVSISVFMQSRKNRIELDASNLLYTAMQNAEEASKEKNKEKSDEKVYLELKTKALNQYDEIIKRYGNTKTARLANFYKGNLYYDSGDYGEALKAYELALSRFKKRERVRAAVLTDIAYTREAMGNWKEACENLKEAAGIDLAPQKDHIYYKAGKCFSKIGKPEEAKRYFRMIVSEYPGSSLLDVANASLAGK